MIDRNEDDPWVTSMVTSALITELRDAARRVVCVLNTTGRARRLACKACRAMTTCERCRAPVEETSAAVLHCRRCATDRPPICQSCGSSRLVRLQPGISRLREELEAAAARPVVEVGGSRKGQELEPADVYVGTEAVLHRVRRIDTVAFLDLDGELLAPRYRAAEQALSLIARAARLVGGRANGGRLLLQTHLPEHEVIDAVRHLDPTRAVPAIRAVRRDLRFPPYAALAALSGPAAPTYAAALAGVVAAAEPPADRIEILGPSDGRFLLRASTPDALAEALSAVPRGPGTRLVVDPPRV